MNFLIYTPDSPIEPVATIDIPYEEMGNADQIAAENFGEGSQAVFCAQDIFPAEDAWLNHPGGPGE